MYYCVIPARPNTYVFVACPPAWRKPKSKIKRFCHAAARRVEYGICARHSVHRWLPILGLSSMWVTGDASWSGDHIFSAWVWWWQRVGFLASEHRSCGPVFYFHCWWFSFIEKWKLFSIVRHCPLRFIVIRYRPLRSIYPLVPMVSVSSLLTS